MENQLPLVIPVAVSILVGLAISIPLIAIARQHGWFEGGHIITRKQFDAKLEDAFRGRPPMSSREHYEKYFASLGIPETLAVRVRRLLEELFEADFSRMKDDDDFSKELSFFWEYDSMVDVEIVVSLEKEFNITISNAEAAEMKTLRAMVETVWRKTGCPTEGSTVQSVRGMLAAAEQQQARRGPSAG